MSGVVVSAKVRGYVHVGSICTSTYMFMYGMRICSGVLLCGTVVKTTVAIHCVLFNSTSRALVCGLHVRRE